MTSSLSFAFPLQNVSDKDLQELGKVLWHWVLCGRCDGRATCLEPNCPWYRARRLTGFWAWYKEITAAYVPELFQEQPALRAHKDLSDIIQFIKENPDLSRAELTQSYFALRNSATGGAPALSDQSRAFSIAASILFMVGCAMPRESLSLLEHGQLPILWKPELSATDFVKMAFPVTAHPYFDQASGDASKDQDIKKMSTATNLKKIAGLQCEATNDLVSHLKLDRRRGVVQVFHQTAALKESLLARDLNDDSAAINSVSKGNVPRALALETLDTIHKVLFPPDRNSQALLSMLVSRHSFDQDCLRYESARYRSGDDTESSYPYFGSRLAELYEEMQNPTPRGWLNAWFERRSGARYVMMATMVGVFIAIVIGLLGLGVAGFQAWVSWQQWKHPVSP